MLEKLTTNEELKYEKLSPEEMESRGILGRLYGPCADIINSTRNGRKYSEELWEKVFENPIMQEKFERGGVFGECGHPVDREEIDIEKIALCMPQPPKKDNNGTLVAIFDILSTPCGKILKTLCDYGYKIGISSRGTGEVYTDENGDESVDPDSYNCECFDAVLIPAVKAATLNLMHESLETKSIHQALTESLNSANEADRKLMQETLNNLHISYSNDKEKAVEAESKADNIGDELVVQLQESLMREKELQNLVKTLQESLSVSNAKEVQLKEKLSRFRDSIINLKRFKEKADSLEVNVAKLNEQINLKDKELLRKDSALKTKDSLNEQLLRSNKAIENSNMKLKENAQSINSDIKELKNEIKSLNESLNAKDAEHNRVVETLNENIQELKKDSAIKHAEYKQKLGKSNELVERYKKIAQSAVSKYIDSQARIIGVSPNEIKNRLTENYSFQEIDKVVESLKSYNLNISKLPINIERNNNKQNIKMKVTESYEPIFGNERCDDDIDEQLLNMIK